MARDHVSHDEAADRARRMDHKRQAYVQRYYRHFWADPMLFDAQFNTARMSMDEAVTTVAWIITTRAAARSAHAG
jgi:hypothetical protein